MDFDMLAELKRRDPRFEKGLPTILVCSDSAVLPTGLARVVRGIFKHLYASEEFAIAQHGWFHTQVTTSEAPWPLIPVRRNPADERFYLNDDRFGAQSFDNVVENLKPDIVFVVGDYGTFDHIFTSKHRSSFQLICYLPLDCYPPTERWVECVKRPDRMVYYTDFAKAWGENQGAPGISIPHGVDTENFQPAKSDVRKFMRERFFKTDDMILLGTVSRVQPRKQLPLFIEMVAHLKAGAYARCANCNRVRTYQYIPATQTYETGDELECYHCGDKKWLAGKVWDKLHAYMHSDPTENPMIPLGPLTRYWNIEPDVSWNPSLKVNQSQGVPDQQIAQIYQCLDIYVHCASGGGWELPLVEAAATGLPIVAADAPAQNEYLRPMGATLVPAHRRWDFTCAGYRHFATVEDFIDCIEPLLESAEKRRAQGKKNREFVLDYEWKQVAEQWAEVFRETLRPENRVESWRVLQEI